MNKPVKGLFGKLRRAQPYVEPEPELGADRLSALRIRAALAEDPGIDEDAVDEGLQPVVLARAVRETATFWDNATSWFGGLPKLGAIAWPVGSDDLPLPFAAQISLADIAAASPGNPLPTSGSLAFFLGEGAVIHVPEGVTQYASLPEDVPISQFWPVQAAALTLPAELEGPQAIRAAMEAELAGMLPRRAENFSATRIDWNGPVPVWWDGVDHLIGQLRLALAQAEADGQRDGLSALIGALEGFAADREPWDRLNAEEREVFAEALDNVCQQFGRLLPESGPRSIEDLATTSVLAMMTGDAGAFAALPATARDAINRDYRLPLRGLPQMLGLALDVEDRQPEHLADVLLLQLPSDDMMDWDFGDDGVYQFWIAPEALEARNWTAATLTF